ncbi:hypothetical protein AN1V17_15860 [Vallitalea sediminicola]
MKKNKLLITILIIGLLLLISGCEKLKSVDDPKNLTTSMPSPSDIIVDPILTQEELSLQAYEKFMKNETKVSFDRFMPKDYFKGTLYKEGSEYTLSEVLDIVTAYYFENSTNKKIESIDYSYIDCGMDGVKELVLRFNGVDIYDEDDNSALVYIVKYIEEKLSLCYYYETWARSDSTLNEYGYYKSGGSIERAIT